jgi:hypothetical protein
MDVLALHCRTQLWTPEQRASEPVFPSVNGGFRAASVLNEALSAARSCTEIAEGGRCG